MLCVVCCLLFGIVCPLLRVFDAAFLLVVCFVPFVVRCLLCGVCCASFLVCWLMCV